MTNEGDPMSLWHVHIRGSLNDVAITTAISSVGATPLFTSSTSATGGAFGVTIEAASGEDARDLLDGGPARPPRLCRRRTAHAVKWVDGAR